MICKQNTIFDAIASQNEAMKGMNIATEHAESVHPGWKEITYNLFNIFLNEHDGFLVEDFRAWLYVNHPHYIFPPNNRAFGFVVRRAVKDGLIISLSTRKVSNIKAHSANANYWQKINHK